MCIRDRPCRATLSWQLLSKYFAVKFDADCVCNDVMRRRTVKVRATETLHAVGALMRTQKRVYAVLCSSAGYDSCDVTQLQGFQLCMYGKKHHHRQAMLPRKHIRTFDSPFGSPFERWHAVWSTCVRTSTLCTIKRYSPFHEPSVILSHRRPYCSLPLAAVCRHNGAHLGRHRHCCDIQLRHCSNMLHRVLLLAAHGHVLQLLQRETPLGNPVQARVPACPT